MSRNVLIGIASVVGVFLIGLFVYRSNYNTAVALKKTVEDETWGNVQAAYQRRADLVPQLVATVKGAAKNEQEILTKVTNARAGIVNAETPEQMELLGREINTAINMAFEAYPQIRSTENFRDLQKQLEGTENRINKARSDYNQAVSAYNTHIEGFFNSMLLNKQTFPTKEAFKADAAAANAPTVSFE